MVKIVARTIVEITALMRDAQDLTVLINAAIHANLAAAGNVVQAAKELASMDALINVEEDAKETALEAAQTNAAEAAKEMDARTAAQDLVGRDAKELHAKADVGSNAERDAGAESTAEGDALMTATMGATLLAEDGAGFHVKLDARDLNHAARTPANFRHAALRYARRLAMTDVKLGQHVGPGALWTAKEDAA